MPASVDASALVGATKTCRSCKTAGYVQELAGTDGWTSVAPDSHLSTAQRLVVCKCDAGDAVFYPAAVLQKQATSLVQQRLKARHRRGAHKKLHMQNAAACGSAACDDADFRTRTCLWCGGAGVSVSHVCLSLH